MPTISKKEMEDYRQLCKAKNNGRILTPDGLRIICESLNRDPEAIGKHMLEVLARMQNPLPYASIRNGSETLISGMKNAH